MSDTAAKMPFDPGSHEGYGVSLPGEPGYVAPPASATGSRPVGPRAPLVTPHIDMARIGTRFMGLIIDSLAVSVIPAILMIFGVMNIPTNDTMCETVDPFTGLPTQVPCTTPEMGPLMALLGMVIIFSLLCQFAMVISPIGASGQSIGMKAMGIRALDARTLRPIGLGRAFGRALSAHFISSWFNVGYAWAMFDGRSQTWHDKIVGSIVIRD